MTLLMLGSLFSFIPLLAKSIHIFNDAYTHRILQLTYQFPDQLDGFFTIDALPAVPLSFIFPFPYLG